MEIVIKAYFEELIDYDTMMKELYDYKLRGDNNRPPCWNIEDEEILPF